MIRFALVSSIALAGSLASAAIPPMKIKVLGKPDAPIEGTFYRNVSSEPENFSPLSSQEYVSTQVNTYCMDSLLNLNPDTYEFEPYVAESYEVSKDYLTFTFHLNKKAHFSDGKPLTSDDVRFSIEAIRDPKYKAAAKMPYYEDVETITTPDPYTIAFKMKKKYFKNLEVLATTAILPKHIYQDANAKFPIAPIFGSGPYKVEAYNRGKNIILVRDANWWGNEEPGLKSQGKFERINFRFIKEENLEIEMVKKGQIDEMWPIQAENFEKKAVGEPFIDAKAPAKPGAVRKIEAENKIPKRYSFIAWNEKDPNNKAKKNPLFGDRDVRLAMSMLFNRKLLMDKFMFGKVVEGKGPVYFKSPAMPSDVKAVEYNPEKAKNLLKKLGWEDKDKNGILEKTIDGQAKEFRFTLLLPNRDVEKYFTIYKEDLKKAGIDMEIKLIEWNTFSKLLDEQKFDAVTLAWAGGAPEDDLKQIWHSDSAREGGSNFVSYKNPEVDKLIDSAREEMNKDKRMKMWQKAVRLIAEDNVYTYLFNLKYDQFLANARLGYDKPTYTYDFSWPYWYLTK
jgi:peptide/nickel transport system substrate-binding protein/microcin C transport system substrate-binding protein